MGSRFLSELTLADCVTVGNAAIGFLAIIVAPTDLELAARLILLAAVADGVDGIIARHFGGSNVGPYLDSLADVSSFAIAPAVLAAVWIRTTPPTTIPGGLPSDILLIAPILFVACAIVRLGFYSTYDTAATKTVGAPTTLAATVLAAATLTVHLTPWLMVGGVFGLSVLMVSSLNYPDLLARDAILMGVIHVLTVLFPLFYGRIFPYALVTLAVAYLVLGPWLYWGESERRMRQPSSPKGKRS